jgi:hypothetical protein
MSWSRVVQTVVVIYDAVTVLERDATEIQTTRGRAELDLVATKNTHK